MYRLGLMTRDRMRSTQAFVIEERNLTMKQTQPTYVDPSVTAVLPKELHPGRGVAGRRVVVGKPVPRLRLTAVVKGEYTHLDPDVIRKRWIVLCFPASLRAVDLLCLNHQAAYFAKAGALLVGVASDRLLLQPFHHRQLYNLTVPLFTDPLNRLHRAYGVACGPSSGKANTFLIDPNRVLRHHIVHELTTWNMEALCGLVALGLKQTARTDERAGERSLECRT
jgi:alkyl hydroperoxide reductase subunit AhpC